MVVQHADFWDHDHDGVVWPIDTYRGFRELGWSIILSIIGTLFINGALSYPTCPTLLPDPFFRVFIVRLHKAKHGSDSMSYDHEGRFRPQQFEEIFTKYDRDNKGGLSKGDLWAMWKGQAFVWDFFGWAATAFECESASLCHAECLVDGNTDGELRGCDVCLDLARRRHPKKGRRAWSI